MAKLLYYVASAPCFTFDRLQPQLCTQAPSFFQALLPLDLSHFFPLPFHYPPSAFSLLTLFRFFSPSMSQFRCHFLQKAFPTSLSTEYSLHPCTSLIGALITFYCNCLPICLYEDEVRICSPLVPQSLASSWYCVEVC